MAIGGGVAFLLGASRDHSLMAGIVTAAVLVFGIVDKKRK
jgi:hypothetical protein